MIYLQVKLKKRKKNSEYNEKETDSQIQRTN